MCIDSLLAQPNDGVVAGFANVVRWSRVPFAFVYCLFLYRLSTEPPIVFGVDKFVVVGFRVTIFGLGLVALGLGLGGGLGLGLSIII